MISILFWTLDTNGNKMVIIMTVTMVDIHRIDPNGYTIAKTLDSFFGTADKMNAPPGESVIGDMTG